MKKKIIIGLSFVVVLFGVMLLAFGLRKNKDSSLTKVRLAEVTHSSFYSPLYVAIEKGYFKEAGIDLELILTPGADKVSAAVLSGDVEIGFAGAESAIYVYKQDEGDYLQLFAGLTKRDGQFIVSRKNIKNFKMEDLIGKEVLAGRKGGMPAMTLEYALNQNIGGIIMFEISKYKKSNVKISIRLPETMNDTLKKIAEKENMSFNNVIVSCIQNSLDQIDLTKYEDSNEKINV